ncbi:MAG: N-acetylneuraminate synthase family protein [Micrococcus sp.]|nr:N-acetylneuraminate synthase family protein [Micrococcus sp.]
MIVTRNTAEFVVFSEDSVLVALSKISANKQGVVFCVDSSGVLQGSLSDGDFRRSVIAGHSGDVSGPALDIANRQPVQGRVDQSTEELAGLFRDGISAVPLVDQRGHLAAVATRGQSELRLGRHVVAEGQPSVIIAEIGINHNGSVDLAKHLVDLAADGGADMVKFQLRDMDALYRNDSSKRSQGEDLGPQYTLDLLSKYSLSAEQLFTVFDHCKQRDIDVMCTPWDEPSVQALADYGTPALKIASADLTNHALLRYAGNLRLPMVMSTGMSTEEEIAASADLVRATGAGFALLHCQSTYPAPFKDVNLAYMDRLAEIGQCPVGYSGHERGFHVPIAAVARGARIIEKHFTVDRGMEGNDHKVSLLPDEFAEMVKRIREVEEAIGTDTPRVVSTGEMMNRVNLAKSLVAASDLKSGQTITANDIDIKSPGRGLQPNKLEDLIGRVLQRDIEQGDFFYATDLVDEAVRGRNYEFNRPWGLPVRYHDYGPLIEDSTPDFLEFHFSYKDLEIDVNDVFDEPLDMFYTTHSPDLFAGDFLLNLASEDDEHWERSIRELQRVIDITRQMRPWFNCEQDPVVVASLGGFTKDAFASAEELPAMYARVAAGLARVNTEGVRLCAQTLPPFPWYMGGQLYCNLFVQAQDTADFAREHGVSLCFDVSHSKLAANYYKRPFSEYVELLAPLAEHLHLVDSVGIDGEGVQVGEGEIDWPVTAQQLDRLAPKASFIPEIWQGHVNNGEGFWKALDRLEEWF